MIALRRGFLSVCAVSASVFAGGCLMALEDGAESQALDPGADAPVAVYRVSKVYNYLHDGSSLAWEDSTLALWTDSTGSYNPRALGIHNALPFRNLASDGEHRALFPDVADLAAGETRRRAWYPWGLTGEAVEETVSLEHCEYDACDVRFERYVTLQRDSDRTEIRQTGNGVVSNGRYLAVTHRFEWSQGADYRRDDHWELVFDEALSQARAEEEAETHARRVEGAASYDAWHDEHPPASLAREAIQASVEGADAMFEEYGRLGCHRGRAITHRRFVTGALPEVTWRTLLSLPPTRGRGVLMAESAFVVGRLPDALVDRIAEAAAQDPLAHAPVARIADERLRDTLTWLQSGSDDEWVRERATETLAQLDAERRPLENQFEARCARWLSPDPDDESPLWAYEIELLAHRLEDTTPALRCFARAAESLPEAFARRRALELASGMLFTPLATPAEARAMTANRPNLHALAVQAIHEGNVYSVRALDWLASQTASEAGRQAALAALHSPDDALRRAAAQTLTAWRDARGAEAIATMLEEGRIDLPAAAIALRLAGETSALGLFTWEEADQDAAIGRFREWARRIRESSSTFNEGAYDVAYAAESSVLRAFPTSSL